MNIFVEENLLYNSNSEFLFYLILLVDVNLPRVEHPQIVQEWNKNYTGSTKFSFTTEYTNYENGDNL